MTFLHLRSSDCGFNIKLSYKAYNGPKFIYIAVHISSIYVAICHDHVALISIYSYSRAKQAHYFVTKFWKTYLTYIHTSEIIRISNFVTL